MFSNESAKQYMQKYQVVYIEINLGNSLAVQWLGLGTFTEVAWVEGSIPDLGTKIPQAAWHGQKEKERKFTQKAHCDDHALQIKRKILKQPEEQRHAQRNYN